MAAMTMPDWSQAKVLYSQGVTLKDIATQLGVTYERVRAQSSRHKWTEQVRQAKAIASQVTGVNDKVGTFNAKAKAEAWTETIDGICQAKIEQLKRISPKSMKLRELKELAEVTDIVDKVQRRNLGMDQENSSKTQLAMIGSVHLYTSLPAASDKQIEEQSQVVDVEDVSGGA